MIAIEDLRVPDAPLRRRHDRGEERARSERAKQDAELTQLGEARQAAELATGRAQAALEAEQRLRAQLEKDLAGAQRRLEAAETARDAAIASIQAAATRTTTPPARGRRTKDS